MLKTGNFDAFFREKCLTKNSGSAPSCLPRSWSACCLHGHNCSRPFPRPVSPRSAFPCCHRHRKSLPYGYCRPCCRRSGPGSRSHPACCCTCPPHHSRSASRCRQPCGCSQGVRLISSIYNGLHPIITVSRGSEKRSHKNDY